MKNIIKNSTLALLIFTGFSLYAQKNNRSLDNYREPDKNGINVFESPKDTLSTFDNVKVRVGGSSTIQYQALDHENSGDATLANIGNNFNLATANLDLDVALYDGVRMHLRTYLSSRHHNEPYVKGGYLQIDKLEFISEGFMEDFMKYTTLKIGHMENNYGDTHFRRSDNSQTIHNPFVGNLIMDAFTTEVGAELYYQRDGFIGMIGFTNGKLNQSPENTLPRGSNVYASDYTGGASFLAKVGYDKQINEDFRFRLTGSLYNTGYVPSSYLYSADRAGSRYYNVMEGIGSSAFRSGRYDPGLKNEITAIMFNPFVKYKGLEFFGTIETAKGKKEGFDPLTATPYDERTANQFAGELIYRFGESENYYIGARYNKVDSKTEEKFTVMDDIVVIADAVPGEDIEISRFQLAAGWFMTKNILLKAEYVSQKYDGYSSGAFKDGKFDGLMIEAAISF